MHLKCKCCQARLSEIPEFAGPDRLAGVPGRFEVLVCRRCGSGTTIPVADESELSDFYPADYNPYQDWTPPGGLLNAMSKAIRRFITGRALRTLPLVVLAGSSGNALDVGCGRGDLGALLITQGWKVSGVEPSPAAAEAARERGMVVETGTLGTVDLPGRPFDVVVFQHSLEHVVDPGVELSRASEILAPGGTLLISVPNFGSLQRRAFGARWFHLDLPRHRFHFTEQGLRDLIERTGLIVNRTGTSSSPVGLPGSITYALCGRWVFNGPIASRFVTLASLAIYPIALLMAIPHGGEVLHMVASKPNA